MEKQMITIPKQEYEELIRLRNIDFELLRQFKDSLEDVKAGRIRRVA